MEGIIYEIVHSLILMLAGVLIWKRATRPKYRWKCPVPGCTFSVSSPNDPSIVTYTADKHIEGALHG